MNQPMGEMIISLIAALGAVLVVMYIIVLLFQKVNRNTIEFSSIIEHVASYRLGYKEKVSLLKISDKYLLVSITPGRIERLAEYESMPASFEALISEQKQNKASNLLAQRLGL